MRLILILWIVSFSLSSLLSQNPEGLEIVYQPSGNSILVSSGGKILAVNSAPNYKVDAIFLTDNRRETVERAINSRNKKTQIFARDASKPYLEGAEAHWQEWWVKRFDYYDQQVTKIPTQNLPADRYLKDSETINWEDITITCLALPGYTKDGTGYLIRGAGRNTIAVGALIYEGGKVPDLYSFQSEIKAAKIGNYHGHLGRLPVWIDSLRKLKKTMLEHEAIVIPAYGQEVSTKDIDTAITCAQTIYRNYLSTNALYWYFGEERMGKSAELVLGENHNVKGMPFAESTELPNWCEHIGTTKLIKSESGNAFVLDVGSRDHFETLFKYLSTGLVKSYDGIFVTHPHNDHSAFVADAEAEFRCPIYSINEVCEVMSHPTRFHLPGLPNKPIENMVPMKDGQQMKWQEFTFTFRFFPGQMYYHAALLVEKQGDTPVFFIGDSFSPSGIDDYCMMNRNLMDDRNGYFRCFKIVESLPKGTWLVNQHINHRFRFNQEELNFIKSQYQKRRDLIAAIHPRGIANYAIDEQKAWFYPYGQVAKPGQKVRTQLKITNHDSIPRNFQFTIAGTDNLKPLQTKFEARLDAYETKPVEIPFNVNENATPERTEVYTATIDGLIQHSVEGLVRIMK